MASSRGARAAGFRVGCLRRQSVVMRDRLSGMSHESARGAVAAEYRRLLAMHRVSLAAEFDLWCSVNRVSDDVRDSVKAEVNTAAELTRLD